MARPRPRTLLWETWGKFGPEFVNGVSRSVLKIRGLAVVKFRLVGREKSEAAWRATLSVLRAVAGKPS